jgi:hypothetical protein
MRWQNSCLVSVETLTGWPEKSISSQKRRAKAMPKAFDDCRKAGGKIRTKKLSEDTYMPVCIRPKGTGPRGGRTVAGEIRKKKS